MQNSLGLDVHGAAESQGQEDTEFRWGVLAEAGTTEQDDAESQGQEDAELRWGAEAGTTQQDDVWTGGADNSWGISSTTEQDDIWNKGAVDSWGTLEEASSAQNDVAPKKDKEVGLEEEEPGTTQKDDKSKKDKGTPYVPATPPARAKMTPEELAERMEKIRLQNERIKERREHVKADEEAFNTSVAADRARQAANRKVQAQINQNRELNAKKKLDKMGNREWDSDKHSGEWKRGTGRGKPAIYSSKYGGRQPPGKARYHTDTTLPEANKPFSHDDDPDVTSETKTDDFDSPDTQDVAEQD
ncbi:hypothetical protein JB92DRAFT_2920540 [Gautieria morchelliformis]|nr:hypothetical protein JB92DRAFT_2920540 [Gautieria morchelliformis]